MRHYVMEKCTDLIGWIQYSPLQALYDASKTIFELSSLENHIVLICMDYLRRICELYSDFLKWKALVKSTIATCTVFIYSD